MDRVLADHIATHLHWSLGLPEGMGDRIAEALERYDDRPWVDLTPFPNDLADAIDARFGEGRVVERHLPLMNGEGTCRLDLDLGGGATRILTVIRTNPVEGAEDLRAMIPGLTLDALSIID